MKEPAWDKWSIVVLAIVLTILPPKCGAQTLLSEVDAVKPTSVRPLLGEQGGLEKAAQQAKHVYIHIHSSQYQGSDLPHIYSQSSLVVVGKCTDRQTSWDSSSNQVTSSYTVHVDGVLKGKMTTQPLILTVPGGVVAFSDVAIAEVESTEYNSLTLGAERIFFLVESSNGVSLANGIEGLFSLDLPTGKITSMSSYDKYAHRLATQDFGRLASFVPMLTQLTQPTTH